MCLQLQALVPSFILSQVLRKEGTLHITNTQQEGASAAANNYISIHYELQQGALAINNKSNNREHHLQPTAR